MEKKGGEEEWNRDCHTSEMSPLCLAVAVESQGTAVTQEEAMCRAGGSSVIIIFAQMCLIRLFTMSKKEEKKKDCCG